MQRITLHSASRSVSAETGLDGAVVDDILRVLRRHTGVDFSGYRRSTLERRIANRMLSVVTPSSKHYLELLRSSGIEATRLLERLTIKVSRFYRHSLAFDVLRAHVLPQLAREQPDRPAAVWSVGCGAGEEPYTLAMLFDAAGISSEIHATDVDRSALVLASAAVFPSSALRELPADLLERYLEPVPDAASCRGETQYRVRESLRGRVHFRFHDITSSRPPPGPTFFDLISCRNLLIYLQRELQE
ncbi:MAG TPA: protein-glutamate O-methyltransferase CheR, partial [Steroidobacteraceae bacterium]